MKHYYCSVELFKQMNAIHVPVNAYTISIVIKCCCEMYRTIDGFAALGYCYKHAILPNVCIFTTLLNGLILEDRVLEAEMLFKKLIKEEICEPNAFMYSTMIKGLCKFSYNDTAIALLKLMVNSNIIVYNILINGASKSGKLNIARILFNDLTVKGLQPDVRTYTVMISGFLREGLVGEAILLFSEMENRGFPSNGVTYNILLQGLLKNQQLEKVEMFLHEIEGRGFSLDASSVSLLLDNIKVRSLDASLLKLIGKLVLKEDVDAPCFVV